MPFVYILYSNSADKFYIGATQDLPNKRLQKHKDKFYGNRKFTSKYEDWMLFHAIKCSSFSQARQIEIHIKKMKNKAYIRIVPHDTTFAFNRCIPYFRAK